MSSVPAFEMVQRKARADLSGMVLDLAGYRETGTGHIRQIELATLVIPIVISFGAPFEIGLGRQPTSNDRHLTFAAGLFAGPVVIDSFGASNCLQINFTPPGARAFFSLPLSELTDRMVALDDLDDTELRELPDKLAGLDSWEARFDLVEEIALCRIRAAQKPDTRIAFAYRNILASGGKARISSIARELELSRKHLTTLFSREIGLAPKTIARITRFRRAISLANQPGAAWADVAAATGYADQAHLTREFREFSGESPAAWKSRIAG